MIVTVPDKVAKATDLTPEQALLDIAIGIYKREQWSMGKCAEIVGMTRTEFQHELGRRKIPINLDADEIEQDYRNVQNFLATE